MSAQTFLITGATAGIGLAVAARLAAVPNSTVFITGRNKVTGNAVASNIIGDSSSKVIFVVLDVTNDESIVAANSEVAQILGDRPLDVLINNAGILCENPAEGSLRERMLKAYETNTVGPTTVANIFLPLIKKAKHPRIINISALAGSITIASSKDTSRGAFWTYGPSKAALNYITAVLGVANPDIRVVSICPGLVQTKLVNHNKNGKTPEIAAAFIVKTALDMNGASPAYFNEDGVIDW